MQGLLEESKRDSTTRMEPESSGEPLATFNGGLAPTVSNFEKLVSSATFVDKSGAIEEFLSVNRSMDLILRPKKSGKSTLLTMFRSFFEHLQIRQESFKSLQISRSPYFKTHFKRFPVIHISFVNVKGSTWETMVDSIQDIISHEFRRIFSKGHISKFQSFEDEDRLFINGAIKGDLGQDALQVSLRNLSQYLCLCYREEVLVLIDEYDMPLVHAAGLKDEGKTLKMARRFFHRMYTQLLKDNPYIYGALILGLLRTTKTGWLSSGLDMLSEYPLYSEEARYSTALMFTEEEAQVLYDHTKRHSDIPFEFKELKGFYGGYSVSDGTRSSGEKLLYNPWVVSNALAKKALKPYWIQLGSEVQLQSSLFERADKFKQQLNLLLAGEICKVDFDEYAAYRLGDISDKQLWGQLLSSGYIALAPDRVSVSIPTKEIRLGILHALQEKLKRQLRASHIQHVAKMLLLGIEGNITQLSHELNHLAQYPSSFGCGGGKVLSNGKTVPDLYHAFIYGLFLVCAGSECKVTVELEGGTGQMDLKLEERYGHRGAIIELSTAAQEGSLRSEAESGLLRVKEKDYSATFKAAITCFHEYSAAFHGQHCEMLGRTRQRGADGEAWVDVDLAVQL